MFPLDKCFFVPWDQANSVVSLVTVKCHVLPVHQGPAKAGNVMSQLHGFLRRLVCTRTYRCIAEAVLLFHNCFTERPFEMDLIFPMQGGTWASDCSPCLYLQVHKVQVLEFGRMYSQKWVLLSREFPYAPVWMSSPFRLPEVRSNPST